MTTVRLALHAMATRFELILVGEDETLLRSAGEEALREIASLDRRLSFYSATSEVSALNRVAAQKTVAMAPDLFELLTEIQQLVEISDGTFDPSIGPLMRAWGFVDGSGMRPEEAVLNQAKAISGFDHVQLDSEFMCVRYDRAGVELDLGAIGKGYALDQVAKIIADHKIPNALLHGGTSTGIAMGRSFDDSPWRIGIQDGDILLGCVDLEDMAFSISATSGKRFFDGDSEFGHVIDPRSGRPSSGAAVAAVMSRSATIADALSTAALVLASDAHVVVDSVDGVVVWDAPTENAVLFSEGVDFSSVRNLS